MAIPVLAVLPGASGLSQTKAEEVKASSTSCCVHGSTKFHPAGQEEGGGGQRQLLEPSF